MHIRPVNFNIMIIVIKTPQFLVYKNKKTQLYYSKTEIYASLVYYASCDYLDIVFLR